MSYKNINALPRRIRHLLPEHAQKIYMQSYNNAIQAYQNPRKIRENGTSKKSPDVIAHKVAWAAVKKKYKKDNLSGNWIEK